MDTNSVTGTIGGAGSVWTGEGGYQSYPASRSSTPTITSVGSRTAPTPFLYATHASNGAPLGSPLSMTGLSATKSSVASPGRRLIGEEDRILREIREEKAAIGAAVRSGLETLEVATQRCVVERMSLDSAWAQVELARRNVMEEQQLVAGDLREVQADLVRQFQLLEAQAMALREDRAALERDRLTARADYAAQIRRLEELHSVTKKEVADADALVRALREQETVLKLNIKAAQAQLAGTIRDIEAAERHQQSLRAFAQKAAADDDRLKQALQQEIGELEQRRVALADELAHMEAERERERRGSFVGSLPSEIGDMAERGRRGSSASQYSATASAMAAWAGMLDAE